MFHHHVVIQPHFLMEQLKLIFEYNNLFTTLVLCSAATLHVASSSAQWRLPIQPERRTQHRRAEETRPWEWTSYAPDWLAFISPHCPRKYTPYSSNGTELSICRLFHQYLSSPAVGCVFLCIVWIVNYTWVSCQPCQLLTDFNFRLVS